jgi:hypothetical protein
MKQTVQHDAAHAQAIAEPARSRPARQSVTAPGRHMVQLAARINDGSRTLTQVKDGIQHSSRVQRLMGLAAEINQAAPAQLQGVPVNNDAELEREADVMGKKAMQKKDVPEKTFDAPVVPAQLEGNDSSPPKRTGLPEQLMSGVECLSGVSLDNVRVHYNSAKPAQLNALGHTQVNTSNSVLQAKFVQLSEARIIHIRAEAEKRGEDLETDYLQGLVEKESDQVWGEHGKDNPELFIPIARIVAAAAYRDISKGIEKKTWIYAPVENLAGVEDQSSDHVLNYVNTGVKLYTDDQSDPFTVQDIVDWLGKNKASFSENTIAAIHNDVVFSALTGGRPLEDDGGGYGNVEFRFKAVTGQVYVDQSDAEAIKQFQTYKNLTVYPVPKRKLAWWQEEYKNKKLPYAAERIGPSYLYIETSLIDLFGDALLPEPEGFKNPHIEQKTTAPNQAAALAAPLATPKKREKTYTGGAIRGSRGAGQKQAMGNYSAKDYVKLHNSDAAEKKSWEWLHIQGSKLGGPNRPENLVAGTAEANTQMIPYEKAIYKLSRLSARANPVKIEWEASVQDDSNGQKTHIGNQIQINATFPQGAPADIESESPAKLASQFPVTVNAIQGATFTKLDRDTLESRTKK